MLCLKGGLTSVNVDEDLGLVVCDSQGDPLWRTSASARPALELAPTGDGEPVTLPLADAGDKQVEPFDDQTYRGYRVRLRGFADTDVAVDLILAMSADGELLVEVAQSGGDDVVQRVTGLYDWKLEPAAGAYTVLPHGNGYLVRSDSAEEVELKGLIGCAWSMPMFGLIRGNQTCYQIIETWWDANVLVSHKPGDGTTLSVTWEASQGKLAYPRRMVLRFARNLDHVGMAKAYRRYLIERGEFKTLAERARTLPSLREYLTGIEYRASCAELDTDGRRAYWEEGVYQTELENIRRFQEAGLPVSFFFPKWSEGTNWQLYLESDLIPGGWRAAKKLLDAVHDLGCSVKLMVIHHSYLKDKPHYDPGKATDIHYPAVSSLHSVNTLKLMLDRMESEDFKLDALYFDGSSAFGSYSEHTCPDDGPVTRRQTFETQCDCYREARRRGVVPGGELARFWSVADADFFFFTDWAPDRLRHGEPVPLFALVFHDCFTAHFAGGGFYNEGNCDWYEDRSPRLYELMYGAQPSHNWLPGGSRAIQAEDWDTDNMARRLKWLKRWHTYHQAICYSEMVDHRFLNAPHTLQRIEFANGIVAEFDLDKGLFRVEGIDGFSGDWEEPDMVER